MTSQSERDIDELVKRLEEKFDLSSRITIVERDLAAANAATSVAFKSKKEHDDYHNEVLDALKLALSGCVTEAEYNRRHDELLGQLGVERDFRNKLLGFGVPLTFIWPIIVAMVVVWLRK